MIYDQHLEAILVTIQGLNDIEKKTDAIENEHPVSGVPFIKSVKLTDGDGVDWGELRDEIGGEWGWTPPAWTTVVP